MCFKVFLALSTQCSNEFGDYLLLLSKGKYLEVDILLQEKLGFEPRTSGFTTDRSTIKDACKFHYLVSWLQNWIKTWKQCESF